MDRVGQANDPPGDAAVGRNKPDRSWRGSGSLSYLDNFVCRQTMRVAVDLRDRLRVRRLREAEDFTRPLVVPVPNEADAKLSLDCQILLVRGVDGIRR